MKKIGTKTLKRYATLLSLLESKSADAEAALGAVQTAIEDAESQVQEAIDNVVGLLEDADAVRQEAHDLVEACHDEAEAYFDDRSDKWRESDRGGQYEGWVQRLDTLRNALAEPLEMCDTEAYIQFDADVEFPTENEDLTLPESPEEL